MEIRKKRLAVVCGLYDGGTEIAMVRLLERLDYHDVDVTLITQDPSGPIEPRIPPRCMWSILIFPRTLRVRGR